MSGKQKIFISCGELSGESHASRLVIELYKRNPDLEIKALGSDILHELGVKLIQDYQDYSFSGVSEVAGNLNKILSLKDKLIEELEKFQPDVVVLVDYGAFNLQLAATIKTKLSKQPKIIEYIAPQIWASRPWRIKQIKACVDKVLCTLPFEGKLYKEADIPHKYVGNPVIGSLTRAMSKDSFLKQFAKIQASKGQDCQPQRDETLIGLFPGSRKAEIKYMLPVMIEASNKLIERNPERNLRFILARAPNIPRSLLKKYGLASKLDLARGKRTHHIEVLDADDMLAANHKLLSASDALWLCSGTVTLEAALYTTPYFLAYKSTLLNYLLYLMLRTIDKAGLANIISGKDLCKEFLQFDASVHNFIEETEAWLGKDDFSDYYYQIKNNLNELKEELSGQDSAKLAASEVLGHLN